MKHQLIKNARIVNENKILSGDVLITDSRIAKVDSSISHDPNWEIIDALGKYLIPGIIDTHVHFREPGLTQKGTMETESLAAIAGGVTSYMDMPNTFPNATRIDLLEEKYRLAAKNSYANYSFYMGVNSKNIEEALKVDNEEVCGLTDDGLYFSEAGSMLCNKPDYLEQLFSKTNSLVALHCEDETIINQNEEIYKALYKGKILPFHHSLIRSEEACITATKRVIEIARKHNTRLHILHVSTKAESELFQNKIPTKEKRITAEACLHHLYFSDSDYEKKGMKIKWNPSIKTQADKLGLLKAIKDGRIDNIATDHAPHLITDKNEDYFKSSSGAPSIQEMLPALIELYGKGLITMENIVEKTSHNPSTIFKIKERGFIREGFYADLVILDPLSIDFIREEDLNYKCKWSPFTNDGLKTSIEKTFVNGELVYNNGFFTGTRKVMRLKFEKYR